MIRSRLGYVRRRSAGWLTTRRLEFPCKDDGRQIFSRPLLCLCRQFSQQDTPCIQNDDDDTTNTPQPNSLRLLNKTLYETTTKCQRLGWYARRSLLPSDKNPQMSSTKEYLFRQGNDFEDYVYKHKYGYDPSTSIASSKTNEEGMTIHQSSKLAVVHEKSPFEASMITKQLIDNSAIQSEANEAADIDETTNMQCAIDTILQPTFVCGNNRIVARADVLVRLHKHTIDDPSTTIHKPQNDEENTKKGNHNALLSNLENLKVVDLKNLCREHGLKVSGTKAVLKHRLREHAMPTIQQSPTADNNADEITDDESVATLHENSQPWEIVEIKSSTSVRKKIPDLAFTVCVARLAGVNVAKASLVLVDSSYVHSDNSKNEESAVYKTVDCTELVEEYIRKKNMGLHIFKLDYVTGNSSSRSNNSCNKTEESLSNVCDETADDNSSPRAPPQIHYKITCGNCELLGVACGPKHEDNGNVSRRKPEHGIWELPRLSKKTFPQILKHALPTLELKDLATAVPPKLLTKSQARVMEAAATNAVVIDRTKLKEYLLSITAMAASLDDDDQQQQQQPSMIQYLDFEAVNTWMPPHPGMVPYESMVTQYSLHSKMMPHQTNENYSDSNDDGDLFHSEYLADPQRDCRRELLERLLADLGYDLSSQNPTTSSSNGKSSSNSSRGPILVYSSYEKTQLSKFSKLFPEHTEAISDIIDHRLIDLEKIIRECVSHPDFNGRTSIKVTLPALCPGFENSYQELSERTGIGEGGAAIAAFVELMSLGNQPTPADAHTIAATRAALLEYCKLDTLALVELHKALWKLLRNNEEKEDIVSSEDEYPLVVKVPDVSKKQQQKIAIADEFLRQVA